MFTLSTQLKYWTFSSADELEELRKEAREAFIKRRQEDSNIKDNSIFLSYDEECQLRKYYEGKLRRFCQRFQPQMPNYVLGTAMAYFKRIYLHNSIMEPTAEDFMYTCVYLACKVEEFNLTMQQFLSNIDDDQTRENRESRILVKELRLMEMLHYHLTVHNPHRALEGLLIDVKTKCTDIADTERLRPFFEQFFNKSVLTDACLLFPPSQIALAAMITSATNLGLNAALDSYIANKLLCSGSYETQQKITSQLQKIRQLVRKLQEVSWPDVLPVVQKLNHLHKKISNSPKRLKEKSKQDVTDDDDDDDNAIGDDDGGDKEVVFKKRIKLLMNSGDVRLEDEEDEKMDDNDDDDDGRNDDDFGV